MKRGSIQKLSEPIWFSPIHGDPLELCIVPGAASMTPTGNAEAGLRYIATKVLVDFRGYTEDDGTPIENKLAARLELARELSGAIFETIAEARAGLLEGEGSAASD